MKNPLHEILKEMVVKEKKLKEYKRRIHAKGEIIEKKNTDKGNIKLKVQQDENKYNFIIIKSHKEIFEIAGKLQKGEYVSATGIPKFRYLLCTRLKKIRKIDKSVQVKLCQNQQ
ncbi:MAG: hypothetical protein KAK00_06285 [Nanoarchaeota archaeon]|nr:hypothetical protein [Nanoarchaeota archaeon]